MKSRTVVSHVLENLPKVFSDGVFTKHIVFEDSRSGFNQSPIVSVVLAYFPSEVLPSLKEMISLQIQHEISTICFANEDVEGHRIGWGVENDFPTREDSQKPVGTIFMACIGWKSEDSFWQFEQSENFRQYKREFQSLDGLIKLETFYMQSKKLA
jgi:hypothetical protein